VIVWTKVNVKSLDMSIIFIILGHSLQYIIPTTLTELISPVLVRTVIKTWVSFLIKNWITTLNTCCKTLQNFWLCEENLFRVENCSSNQVFLLCPVRYLLQCEVVILDNYNFSLSKHWKFLSLAAFEQITHDYTSVLQSIGLSSLADRRVEISL